MKPITIWERHKKDDKGNWSWEHNHIEDGYDPARTVPTSINEDQCKGWKGSEWKMIEGVMTDTHEVFTKIEYEANI